MFCFFRCGYPCPHVLKVTNKLTIEMIKVQHWKLYASHYNDDDDTLGIGLELKSCNLNTAIMKEWVCLYRPKYLIVVKVICHKNSFLTCMT